MRFHESKVCLKKTVLMQRIQDAVSQGYTEWTGGSVLIEKAEVMAKRFAINYQMDIDRNAMARRKRAGLGNARMILFDAGLNIDWWLMVTPPEQGKHAAQATEKLMNVFDRNGRIIVDGGFELIRLTKKGAEKPTLTWRMTEDEYQGWRDLIRELVRQGTVSSLNGMLFRMFHLPGFSGIRSQVGHLAGLYRAEVSRSGRKGLPELPRFLPYVRRLRDSGVTLRQLIRMKKNLSNGENLSNDTAKRGDCHE